MDKEVRDKHYRVVGQLQGLESLAKAVYCMPSDGATAALLDAVRGLLQRTVTSAWDYAEKQTAPYDSAEGSK